MTAGASLGQCLAPLAPGRTLLFEDEDVPYFQTTSGVVSLSTAWLKLLDQRKEHDKDVHT